MIAVSAHVWTVYHSDPAAGPTPDIPLPGIGADDLIAGLTAAFETPTLIQRGIGVVMAERGCSAEDACLELRVRAAETGAGLTDIAAALLHPCLRRGREPGA